MLGCYAGRVSVRTDFDCITDHPPTSAGGVFRFLARHFDQIQIKSSFHWQL
jgi:hypothetical protein